MGLLSGLSKFGVNMDGDIYGDNKARDNAESEARAAAAKAEAEKQAAKEAKEAEKLAKEEEKKKR